MRIIRTQAFEEWFLALRDRRVRSRIADRIDRLASGNAGVFRNVGGGVLELKLDFGPGYRIYYLQQGNVLILLLCGGDKGTQPKDIDRARALAEELK